MVNLKSIFSRKEKENTVLLEEKLNALENKVKFFLEEIDKLNERVTKLEQQVAEEQTIRATRKSNEQILDEWLNGAENE